MLAPDWSSLDCQLISMFNLMGSLGGGIAEVFVFILTFTFIVIFLTCFFSSSFHFYFFLLLFFQFPDWSQFGLPNDFQCLTWWEKEEGEPKFPIFRLSRLSIFLQHCFFNTFCSWICLCSSLIFLCPTWCGGPRA